MTHEGQSIVVAAGMLTVLALPVTALRLGRLEKPDRPGARQPSAAGSGGG